MGFKDLGPDVSQSPANISTGGSFSGEEKSYESLVVQDDRPVIDWEMNLRNEIATDHGYRQANQRIYPSHWTLNDFLETNDVLGSYVMLPAVGGNENKFNLLGSTLLVNGWSTFFEFSETSSNGLNSITLPAPPVAGTRTDLVILEVWRALISPAPSLSNKSPTGLILRHGNVKAPDAVNLTDDLIDPNFAAESSKRVQIQYRYRVIEGIDLDAYPDGLDDPLVFAHTVSDFTGSGADGTVTVINYAPHPNDPGLWTAGTGDGAGAAALETVDGFMYALPICAVFRRNTTAFARGTNNNGGTLIASGTSDRPDGLFSDQIVAEDIKDLRKGISFDSFQSVQKSSQQLMDNTLSTNHELVGGSEGTSITVKDDIGLGAHIGDSDQVRRRFSDRSIIERVMARVDVVGAVASIVIPLTAVPIAQGTGLVSVDVDTNSPTGTHFDGLGTIRVVDFAAPTDTDAVFGGGATDIASIFVSPTSVTINFGVASFASVSYFIELLIEYPAGSGLTRNVVDEFEFWTPNPGGGAGELPSWAEPGAGQFPVSPIPSDADRSLLDSSRWSVDRLHREVSVDLLTITQSVSFPGDPNGVSNQVRIPERIDSITLVNGGAFAGTFTTGTADTIITDAVNIPAGPSTVTVDYVATRALPPPAGAPADSFQVWTKTRAIQSLDVPAGNVTLDLIPRAIQNEMVIMTVGSGSPDASFPFIDPSSQISVAATPSPDFPESRLDSPGSIQITGFGGNTGFIQMATTVPYSPAVQQVTLERQAGDADVDAEGRHFWSRGAASFYTPSAFTFPLLSPQRHKTAIFTIMELKDDFASIGRKGTHVLVVFSNWIESGSENDINMVTVPSNSGASVYRIRGNMLHPRRTHV